uniref:Uncharacterized protein n=1 Tax=Micrurus lemniscatus lemniscatus TaxID=129467 RepID=A0A2D4J2B0_MICLE
MFLSFLRKKSKVKNIYIPGQVHFVEHLIFQKVFFPLPQQGQAFKKINPKCSQKHQLFTFLQNARPVYKCVQKFLYIEINIVHINNSVHIYWYYKFHGAPPSFLLRSQ